MPGTYSAGFDRISRTANAPFAVAGAVALDSGIFGRSVVAGSSGANYTITLPASGQANSVLEIIVPLTNAFLVTVAASALIDGNASVVLWAGEVLLLQWDGSTYAVVGGKRRAMIGVIGKNAAQSFASGTATQVTYQTTVTNIGNVADQANNRHVIRRTGNYQVGAWMSFDFGAALASTRNQFLFTVNGTTRIQTEFSVLGSTFPAVAYSQLLPLVAGDLVTVTFYQQSGSAINSQFTPNPVLSVCEFL